MRYLIELRERRYVKGYGFMSFARNFSDKYSKSLMDKGIDVSKKFPKTAGKKILKETAKATGDLIGNKIADKITRASIKSQSDEVNNEILKERYISPQERQRIIDELNLHNTIMEYQKIANLIDDYTSNQPSKFRTRNWVARNDESRGAYNVNSQIKFKTTMLKFSLCDYSDAYILVKETITVNNTTAQGAAANNINKKVIFENCAPFTNCISKINNTQIDNAKDIDIVMPMYNLIEYSDNYAKTTERLWQYCKDIPARDANDEITEFTAANLTDSFNFKVKITDRTGNDGTKDVEIMVPLKYLSNFCRTLEMPLITCEVNLILTWSSSCVLIATNVQNQAAIFEITDAKLYVPVVTLSTQENTNFFQQLKPGFKRVINWNKYLSKPELIILNPKS